MRESISLHKKLGSGGYLIPRLTNYQLLHVPADIKLNQLHFIHLDEEREGTEFILERISCYLF